MKQFQKHWMGSKVIQRIPASLSPRFSSCLYFTTFVPSPFLSYTYRLFQTWGPITAQYSSVYLPKVRTLSYIISPPSQESQCDTAITLWLVAPLTCCQLSQHCLLFLFGTKFSPGTHVTFSCLVLDFFNLQQFLIFSHFLCPCKF